MDNSDPTKYLNSLPAGAWIEHLVGDADVPEKEILSLLKAAMGGDDSPPWPANQRWLVWHSDQLIGHVSVQRRWFVVNNHYFEGWHVGGVCVHPTEQGQGIGTILLEQAHVDLSRQELGFAVLNCASSLTRFYNRVGYTKISDRGMYIRDNQLAIDDDPAMALSFRPAFNVGVLECGAFPFGFDF